ncbi:MAG: hypothetical protein LBP28_02590, partial [Coriobacteriales bacterium]|nr:hypothetical protein [Coriobacteriales bacterium]
MSKITGWATLAESEQVIDRAKVVDGVASEAFNVAQDEALDPRQKQEVTASEGSKIAENSATPVSEVSDESDNLQADQADGAEMAQLEADDPEHCHFKTNSPYTKTIINAIQGLELSLLPKDKPLYYDISDTDKTRIVAMIATAAVFTDLDYLSIRNALADRIFWLIEGSDSEHTIYIHNGD